MKKTAEVKKVEESGVMGERHPKGFLLKLEGWEIDAVAEAVDHYRKVTQAIPDSPLFEFLFEEGTFGAEVTVTYNEEGVKIEAKVAD